MNKPPDLLSSLLNYQKYVSFIFDLDGTILNTKGDIKHCLELAFYDFGLPFKEELLVVGPPLEHIIKIILPDIEDTLCSQVAGRYREYYNGFDFRYTTFYPGILDFIKHLFKENKKLFVATNKPRSSTLLILDKLDLISYFTDLLTPDFFADKVLSKKEMVQYIIEEYHLNPTETIVIGDAKSDIEAGQACGTDTAAHLSGYTKKELLLETGATFSFETC